MKYSEFIWDFDGTLFDTYPVMVKAFQDTLREFGINEKQDVLFRRLKQTVKETVNFYRDRYQFGEEFLEKYSFICQSYPKDQQPPFPGAYDVCQEIVNQGGRNFIVSHRDRVSLIPLLEYSGMQHFFTEIVTSEQGFKRKPDPEAFQYLIEKYQLATEKTVSIGDRLVDMIAARASGLHSIYFCPQNTEICDFANYHIKSLREIVDLEEV